MQTFVLMGVENVGKSTLFNLLTESTSSDERNFRGSTVVCRESTIKNGTVAFVDTPGLRFQSDSETTKLALDKLALHDCIILVLHAPNALQEWQALKEIIPAKTQHLVILLTFPDKVKMGLTPLTEHLARISGAPVITVNARTAGEGIRRQILCLIEQQNQKTVTEELTLSRIPVVTILSEPPQRTLFEHPYIGMPAALLCLFLIFAVPVWLAWLLSDISQPIADELIVEPLKLFIEDWPDLIKVAFVGSYGIFSLGIYSFIWAFPVVVLIGLSLSLTDDSGLKERITVALDPWLRKIGLSGQDLIPVLSGFGCNVVAVFQSRSCSRCNRQACISMIAFGSSCSYQTGATLSLFNAAHHSWLFIPYLGLLFITGTLHTRIWSRSQSKAENQRLSELAWLQRPHWRSVNWMLKNTLRQFIMQAMPLFLFICLVASAIDVTGFARWISQTTGPLLHLFKLPEELMPGIIFSLLRKDGLMVLNQDNGRLIQALSTVQLLVLVWISSTLMACLVTVFTIAREISVRFAAIVVARQVMSSLIIAFIISTIFTHGAR